MLTRRLPLLALDDVTTTPDQPPLFRALERERFNLNRDMRYPSSYADVQRKDSSLKPLHSDLPAAQVFELVQATALESSRWEIAAVEADRLQLEAVAASWIPLVREDVVIQVRPEKDGCTVHMRCKARVRGAMLGGPAPRITEFFKRLARKLA